MKKHFRILILFGSLALLFSACKKNKKDDPKPETPIEVGGGDQENITRLVLYLTNGTEKDTVTFSDPKGNGTNLKIDSLLLKANTTYSVEIQIFDDTKTPVDTVSNEVKEEGNFHRFHFTFSPTSGSASISTTILDQDTKTPPQPIGLLSKIETGNGTGFGKFKISLRHFAEGLEKSDDPAGGEQDILVEFPVRIFNVIL